MTTSHTSQQIIVGALGFTLGLGGCAASQTTARGEPPISVGPRACRRRRPVSVTGPVELLHVNVDKKAGARFIRVPSHEGAMADCGTGAPLAWNGETDLFVQPGESVCVAVVRDARVSWQRVRCRAPAGFDKASLRDDPRVRAPDALRFQPGDSGLTVLACPLRRSLENLRLPTS